MNNSMRRTGPDWNHASTESGFNRVKHELDTGCARVIRAEMTAASFEYIEGGDWHVAQYDESLVA